MSILKTILILCHLKSYDNTTILTEDEARCVAWVNMCEGDKVCFEKVKKAYGKEIKRRSDES